MLLIEPHREVVRYLSAHRENHTIRLLKVDDIHDTLEGQFVEIKTVAHVIIGRNGLWVVVDHHALMTLLAGSLECIDRTPVELDRRADAIGTRTKDDGDRSVGV